MCVSLVLKLWFQLQSMFVMLLLTFQCFFQHDGLEVALIPAACQSLPSTDVLGQRTVWPTRLFTVTFRGFSSFMNCWTTIKPAVFTMIAVLHVLNIYVLIDFSLLYSYSFQISNRIWGFQIVFLQIIVVFILAKLFKFTGLSIALFFFFIVLDSLFVCFQRIKAAVLFVHFLIVLHTDRFLKGFLPFLWAPHILSPDENMVSLPILRGLAVILEKLLPESSFWPQDDSELFPNDFITL